MDNPSNSITDILFDLGNVLMPFDWDIAFRRLFPMLRPDLAQLLIEDKPAFKELFLEYSVAMELGQMDLESFRETMSGILGIPFGVDEFRRIWCDIFTMDQDMIALGERLSRNYRTWLVSNTSKAHYEWIVEHFPRVIFYRGAALSFELNVMKPDRSYYEKVINMFAIKPGSAVFIDDLWENVQGANRLGMHGISFTTRLQLVQELESLGLNF